jgi:hypothetical protein
MTIYPLEFQRRADEKWARAQVPEASNAKWRLPSLVGRKDLAPEGESLAGFSCRSRRPTFYTDRGDVARTGPVPNVLRVIKAAV